MAKLLRVFAALLAIAAVVDPALTSNHRTKPLVAVVAADSTADDALARSVARALENDFTVLHAPFGGAAGSVIVGHWLPANAGDLALPVFSVFADGGGPAVQLDRVDAPSRAPLDARAVVTAAVRVTGARGKSLDVSLRAGGVVLDRVIRQVPTDDDLVHVPLTFVPTATGAAVLRVIADVGLPRVASSDLVIDVNDRQWAVLFFDRRPSWMSTFVRRTIERDPRFVVTSRVVTSRNISTDGGTPPAALDDIAPLAVFDAVVVGAPEALTDRDVSGLDAFLRKRGGSVVLLLDQRIAGPYERLTDAGPWSDASGDAPLAVDPAGQGTGALRATDIAWPVNLPPGARALASSVPKPGDGTVAHPVVWESAVGAGRLIVSGALDAWTSRDPLVSGFEPFWRSAMARAADGPPAAIDIDVARSLVAPGALTEVRVWLRGAALAETGDGRTVHSSIAAAVESTNRRDQFRLWPVGPVGEFRGFVRAPSVGGAYRVVVAGDGSRAEAPIIVATGVTHPTPDDRALVAAWVASRGGFALPASALDQLAARIAATVSSQPHAERWHPMRSPWWIIPFALALGGEWWMRRRKGLT